MEVTGTQWEGREVWWGYQKSQVFSCRERMCAFGVEEAGVQMDRVTNMPSLHKSILSDVKKVSRDPVFLKNYFS